MSNPAPEVPRPSAAHWIQTVVGVLGSILVVALVLGISYLNTRSPAAVNADLAAERHKILSDVQAKEAELYFNYSWVDKDKGVVRIPVSEALKIQAERLGKETAKQPEAPKRLSLAASPTTIPPQAPPPATVAPPAAAPAAGTAPPAAPATAPAAGTAPAAAPAAANAAPAAPAAAAPAAATPPPAAPAQ